MRNVRQSDPSVKIENCLITKMMKARLKRSNEECRAEKQRTKFTVFRRAILNNQTDSSLSRLEKRIA